MSRTLRIVVAGLAAVAGLGWLGFAYWPSFNALPPETVETTRLLTHVLGPVFWLLFALALDWSAARPRVYLSAVLTSVLLWSAFFPLNLGPVAFVALVPLLTLVRAEGVGNRRRYAAAWVGGLAFGFLAVSWVRAAHPAMALFAWPGITLFLSLFFPLSILLLRRLDRLGRPPLAITVPIVWVALEYVRAHFPTGYAFLKVVHLHQLAGFAWYFLGHTQHEFTPLLQAADLGGAYLVSAAVAAVNGAAYDWAVRLRPFQRLTGLAVAWRPATFYREFVTTAIALTLLLGCVGYGAFRLGHPAFDPGPRVAALQENVGQQSKQNNATGLFNSYEKQCEQAVKGDAPPDLVIWPETCFPYPDVTLTAPDGEKSLAAVPEDSGLTDHYLLQRGMLDPRWFKAGELDKPETARFRELVLNGRDGFAQKRWGTNVLLGLNGLEWDGAREKRFNSARLVYADGTPGPRYDKVHLVPFGEYVPFRDSMPWLQAFTPYTHDYSCTPGEALTRFDIAVPRRFRPGKEITGRGGLTTADEADHYRFGVIICYEDSEPSLARRYNPWSGEANPADFLVNISNDGWFDGTEEHEQHLAVCRFRAVEARRSVVRAVNLGISAIIDPDGKVVALPDAEWAKSKKCKAVVADAVPIDHRGSPYAAVGDWVPMLVWALLVGGLLTARFARKKPGATSAAPPV